MSSPSNPRVALVTGTSRGIGTALAAGFAAEGYAVVGCGRSTSPDVNVAGMDYRRCDVSDPAAIHDLVAGTVALHGRLDVLVNNAAVEIEGTVEETTVEQWDEMLTVNVRAPALLAAAAIPHMRAVGGGVILNIASVDGTWAEPRLPAYCATKGALLALTRAMAIDHGADNIRCMSICPGYVRTEMLEQFFAAQPDPGAARAQGRGFGYRHRVSAGRGQADPGLRNDLELRMPIARTDRAWIAFEFDDDLDVAADMALETMLDLMQREYGLGRERALALASVCVDLRVTQIVNEASVHAALRHDALAA